MTETQCKTEEVMQRACRYSCGLCPGHPYTKVTMEKHATAPTTSKPAPRTWSDDISLPPPPPPPHAPPPPGQPGQPHSPPPLACIDEGAIDCDAEFPASACQQVTPEQCEASALIRKACRLNCGVCTPDGLFDIASDIASDVASDIASAASDVIPTASAPAEGCVHEHWTNMNDWYAKYDPPRTARESDCTFICEKGWAKSWCVASHFTIEDNGSCLLSAKAHHTEHTNMNAWYAKYHPPRKARASDCKFICEKSSWAKSWCAHHHFSAENNGSCRLSSCLPTPPSNKPFWEGAEPDLDWSDEDRADAALGAGEYPRAEQQASAGQKQRAQAAADAAAREGGGDALDDPTIQTLEGDEVLLHGVGVFEYAAAGGVASQVYLCPSGGCTAPMMQRGECPTFISAVAVRTPEHTLILRGGAMHLDGHKQTPTGSVVFEGDDLTVMDVAALSTKPRALTRVDASREPPRIAHELRRGCKRMSGQQASSHICDHPGWHVRTEELSIDVGVVGPYEQGWLKEGVSDRTFLLNVSAVKGGASLRGLINGAKMSPTYFNVPDGEVLFPADQKEEMDAQCGPGQALRMLNAAGASASDIRRFREPPAVFRARLEDVHSVSSDVVSESAAAGALALAPNTRH